jgi:hypothetical protein
MGAAPLAQLQRESYISLETFRRDGRAVATPVWFAIAQDKLYVFSEAAAWKVKRLRNDPKIRVSACSVRGGVSGPTFTGSGRRVDESEVEDLAYAALLEKYGWQMRMANFFSRLTGRIDGRAVLELVLD